MSSSRRDLVATLERLVTEVLRRVEQGEDPLRAVVDSGLFRFHATIPVPFVTRRPSARGTSRAYRSQARTALTRLDAGETGDDVLLALYAAWVPLAQACGLAGWGCPGTGTHPSLLSQFTDLGSAGDAWISLARLGLDGMTNLLELADEMLDAAGVTPDPEDVESYTRASSSVLVELVSVGTRT